MVLKRHHVFSQLRVMKGLNIWHKSRANKGNLNRIQQSLHCIHHGRIQRGWVGEARRQGFTYREQQKTIRSISTSLGVKRARYAAIFFLFRDFSCVHRVMCSHLHC